MPIDLHVDQRDFEQPAIVVLKDYATFLTEEQEKELAQVMNSAMRVAWRIGVADLMDELRFQMARNKWSFLKVAIKNLFK